jgi:hypothetical protein
LFVCRFRFPSQNGTPQPRPTRRHSKTSCSLLRCSRSASADQVIMRRKSRKDSTEMRPTRTACSTSTCLNEVRLCATAPVSCLQLLSLTLTLTLFPSLRLHPTLGTISPVTQIRKTLLPEEEQGLPTGSSMICPSSAPLETHRTQTGSFSLTPESSEVSTAVSGCEGLPRRRTSMAVATQSCRYVC